MYSIWRVQDRRHHGEPVGSSLILGLTKQTDMFTEDSFFSLWVLLLLLLIFELIFHWSALVFTFKLSSDIIVAEVVWPVVASCLSVQYS